MCNKELIEINERLGGARSQASAKQATRTGDKTFDESIAGKDDISQFTDLSNPQTETARKSSTEDDKRVRELLGTFGLLNAGRAAVMIGGGVVGLLSAL